MTWANQVRLLTLNIQSLAAILGQGFIPAVLPAVKALNRMISALQKAAKAVRNFFYVLTGYEGGGASGIVSDISDVSDETDDLTDSSGDAADSLEDAAEAAKELKNATLGIDELNIISPDTANSGGTDGTGVDDLGTGLEDIDDELKDLGGSDGEKYVNAWAERIRKAFFAEDWEKLGEEIAWGLNQGLQKVYDVISWDNVGPKIESFTKAFTRTFNSLVVNIDWDLMGRTVGTGINTVVNTLNGAITRINWHTLGRSFADGVMGIVNEVNWKNLGNLLGNYFMISWRVLLGFVRGLDFKEIGRALSDGFNGIVDTIDLSTVGSAIGAGFEGIVTALGEFARNADWGAVGEEVGNGITSFFEEFDFGDLASALNAFAKGLWEALRKAIANIDWSEIFNDITDFFGNIRPDALTAIFVLAAPQIVKCKKALNDLSGLFPKLTSGFKSFKNLFNGNFFKNLATQVSSLRSKLTTLQKTAIGAVSVFAQFSLSKDAFKDLAMGGENVAQSIVKITASAGAAVAALKLIGLSNPWTAVITGATALISAIIGIKQAAEEINIQDVGNTIRDSLTRPGGIALEDIVSDYASSMSQIGNSFSVISEKSQNLDEANSNIQSTWLEIDKIRTAMDAGTISVEEGTAKLSEQFGNLSELAQQKFDALESVILSAFGENGTLTKAYEKIGINTQSLNQTVLRINDETYKSYLELSEKLSNLEVGTPEYTDTINQMYELLTGVSVVDGAISDYEFKVNNLDINYSKLFGEEGELDTSYLEDTLSTLTNAVGDAEADVEESISELNSQLNVELQNAIREFGEDSPEAEEIRNAIDGLPQALDMYKGDIESKAKEITDVIQKDLYEGLADEIEAAEDRWEDMNFFEKMTYGGDIGKYVRETVDNYKENYIDPVSEQINEAMSEAGIDDAGWLSEDTEELINNLFNTAPTVSGSGALTTYKENYRAIIDGTAPEREELSNSEAEAIETGFSIGWNYMTEQLSKIPDSFGKWFGNAKSKVQESWENISEWFGEKWSQIKTFFSEAPERFKEWFGNARENVGSAFSNIGSWFSERWSDTKEVFSNVGSFFSEKFSAGYTNVKNAFKEIGSWFSGKWDDVKNVFGNSKVADFFSEAFQKAYDGITGIFGKIGDFFRTIANNAIAPIGELVNGIIDGINWVADRLGVGKILNNWEVPQFASGSGGIQKNTIGLVNDQKGSKYKELILPPNGQPFIPKGRNVMLPLRKGTKIMPADQTEELMNILKIPKFAGGIGDFFGNAWKSIKDFAGDVWHYIMNPGDLVKVALDKFISLSDFFEPWITIAGGAVNKLFDTITDFVSDLFDEAIPSVNYSPSAGVEQWRTLATKALQMTNQYSESNLDLLLYQMQTESGGNPNAINNWDSNARKGTPSKGLMQVIDPTFKRWAMDGYDTNIYDPLSNMIAAIRYTLNRYGSLAAGWKGHGYAKGIGKITFSDLLDFIPKLAGGGMLMPGQLFVANERGPEVIGNYRSRTTVLNNDQVVQSVSDGVEKAVAKQNVAIASLLQQILDTNKQILAKDNNTYIDGKRANQLLDRSRSNSGYNFRTVPT